MQAIFTPAARAEILDAQDWYEKQRAGLGVRFRGQLEIIAKRMTHGSRDPQRWQQRI